MRLILKKKHPDVNDVFFDIWDIPIESEQHIFKKDKRKKGWVE